MSSVPFTSMSELLRLSQLARALPNVTNSVTVAPQKVAQQELAQQPQGFAPDLQGAFNPQQAQPSSQPQAQPSPQEQLAAQTQSAYSDYQKARGIGAPQLSDYHPSLKRKIFSGILGGLVGMHDLKSGMETGKAIYYGPFNKQMSDYEQRLSEKKQAFEDAQSLELGSAKTGAEEERRQAEGARKLTEEAHRKQIEAEVEHPVVKSSKSDQVKVTKSDGTIILAHTSQDGGLLDLDGNRIPGSEISNVSKLGVDPQDKKTLVKETGEVVDLTKGTKTQVATPVTKTSTAETPEDKNKEWDRRNKIEFNQRLAITRAQLENSLKRQAASSAAPTAQTKSTAEFAKTVDNMVPGIQGEINNLKDKLGPSEGRWNQLWVNKGGLNDPDFAALDQDLKMYATAIIRVYFGLRGGQTVLTQLEKDFSEAQSPEDLKARIEHADKWVSAYAEMNNIKPGSGGVKKDSTDSTSSQNSTPKATRRYNPQTQKLEDIK